MTVSPLKSQSFNQKGKVLDTDTVNTKRTEAQFQTFNSKRLSFDYRTLNLVPTSKNRVQVTPTNELVKRMKQLLHDLKSLDQQQVMEEEDEKATQDTFTQGSECESLISELDKIVLNHLFKFSDASNGSGTNFTYLLSHKDKSIRCISACCIAHLLRLYAPEAPFSEKELVEVFDLFLWVLEFIRYAPSSLSAGSVQPFDLNSQLADSSGLPASSNIIAAEPTMMNFTMSSMMIGSGNEPENVSDFDNQPTNSSDNNANQAYFQYAYILLESLATVKSIILVSELPKRDEYLLKLFNLMFDSIRIGSPANVHLCMVDIMNQLIEEMPVYLPNKLISILLDQISPTGSNPIKDKKAAYRLVADLLRMEGVAEGRLQQLISQYFADTVVHYQQMRQKELDGASVDADGDMDGDEFGVQRSKNKSLFQVLKSLHENLISLHKISPNLLLSVIPQLETELKVDVEEVRALGCQVLGELFCALGKSQASFSQSLISRYQNVWFAWLDKRNDKSVRVRNIWVRYIGVLMWKAWEGKWIDASSVVSGKPGNANMATTSIEGCINYVNALLIKKLLDPEEKVRSSCIQVVRGLVRRIQSSTDSQALMAEGPLVSVSKELLNAIADRMKDKKAQVRTEAIKCLSEIFNLVFNTIIGISEENISDELRAILWNKYSWLPHSMFRYYAQIERMRSGELIDSMWELENSFLGFIDQSIISSSSGADENRSVRAVSLYAMLKDDSKNGFIRFLSRGRQISESFDKWIQSGIEYSEYSMPKIASKSQRVYDNKKSKEALDLLEKNAKSLSSFLPDQSKSLHSLLKFGKSTEFVKICKLIRNCDKSGAFSQYASLNNLLKLKKDVMKRLDKESDIATILESLLKRSLMLFINADDLEYVFEVLEAHASENSTVNNDYNLESSLSLAIDLSKHTPGILAPHQTKLQNLSLLANSISSQSTSNVLLKDILYMLMKVYKYNFQVDGSNEKEDPTAFMESLQEIIEDLLNYDKLSPRLELKICKYACSILCYSKSKNAEEMLGDLVSKSINELQRKRRSFSNDAVYLTILSQHLSLQPSAKIDEIDTVIDVIIKKILGRNESSLKGDEDAWIEDGEINDELISKIAALKLLSKFSIYIHAGDRMRTQQAESIENCQVKIKPVMKVLMAMIFQEGELTKDMSTCSVYKTRLRLQAYLSMLKILRQSCYEPLISQKDFQALAVASQDTCYEVREAIFTKLAKYLSQRRLNFRYLTILLLIAYEPDEELKTLIKSFLVKTLQQMKSSPASSALPETLLYRLLHLLAHHPDFSSDVDDVKLSSKYIEFYLDLISSQNNVSYLYFLASGLKSTVDILGGSENIYLLSDLAQYLIHDKCHRNGWSLPTYPGKLSLPSAMFKPIRDQSEVRSIMTKNYLPVGFTGNRKRDFGGYLKIKDNHKVQKSSEGKSERESAPKTVVKDDDDDDDDEHIEMDVESDTQTKPVRTRSGRAVRNTRS